MIYFIQGIDGGPVKIGSTENVEVRLADLQTGSPVELVVRETIPGSRKEELELHKRFAAQRIRGEWFNPHPAMHGCICEGEKQPTLRARLAARKRVMSTSDALQPTVKRKGLFERMIDELA